MFKSAISKTVNILYRISLKGAMSKTTNILFTLGLLMLFVPLVPNLMITYYYGNGIVGITLTFISLVGSLMIGFAYIKRKAEEPPF